MKRFLSLLALTLIMQSAYSQNTIAKLFNDFEKRDNVMKITLSKDMLSFAPEFAKEIDNVLVIKFQDTKVQEDLLKVVNRLKDPAYELVVSSNNEQEQLKIFMKMEDSMIREAVVLKTGNDAMIIRMNGKISKSSFEELVNNRGNWTKQSE